MSSDVLVVEDDLRMLETLVELVEDLGHNAKGAGSVDEAMALSDSFDLLITDVRMAGIDGIQGFSLLKKRLPKLKCIVITGWASDEASARAVAIEVDEFHRKPIQLDILEKSVERILNPQSAAGYYLDLIKGAPINALKSAMSLFSTNPKTKLENARNRCFKALYTAIKSGYIPADTANGVFCKLVRHDESYQAQSLEPDTTEVNRLVQSYGEIFQYLSALANSGHSVMVGGDRIEPTHFRTLYNAIQTEKIHIDQFFLAPHLYKSSPAELAVKSPQLAQLRQVLWGDAKAS